MIRDACAILGWLLTATGTAWLWHPGAGLIVAGGLLLGAVVFPYLGRRG